MTADGRDIEPTTVVSKSRDEMKLKLKQYLKEVMIPLLEWNGNVSIGVSGLLIVIINAVLSIADFD